MYLIITLLLFVSTANGRNGEIIRYENLDGYEERLFDYNYVSVWRDKGWDPFKVYTGRLCASSLEALGWWTDKLPIREYSKEEAADIYKKLEQRYQEQEKRKKEIREQEKIKFIAEFSAWLKTTGIQRTASRKFCEYTVCGKDGTVMRACIDPVYGTYHTDSNAYINDADLFQLMEREYYEDPLYQHKKKFKMITPTLVVESESRCPRLGCCSRTSIAQMVNQIRSKIGSFIVSAGVESDLSF